MVITIKFYTLSHGKFDDIHIHIQFIKKIHIAAQRLNYMKMYFKILIIKTLQQYYYTSKKKNMVYRHKKKVILHIHRSK